MEFLIKDLHFLTFKEFKDFFSSFNWVAISGDRRKNDFNNDGQEIQPDD